MVTKKGNKGEIDGLPNSSPGRNADCGGRETVRLEGKLVKLGEWESSVGWGPGARPLRPLRRNCSALPSSQMAGVCTLLIYGNVLGGGCI